MIGRASAETLPVRLSEDLKPSLDRVGEVVSNYFRACALALTSRYMPPPLEPLQAALDACASQLNVSRQREPAHLSATQLEQLFAVGFALDQLQRNITDLGRCVREWTGSTTRRRQPG
jgi:hypothetical protein